MIKFFAILSMFVFLMPSILLAETVPELYETYQGARVETQDNLLHVSTGRISRSWKWTGRGLVTTGLKDINTGRQWAASESSHHADWNFGDLGKGTLVSLKVDIDDDEQFTTRHLAVEAEIHYPKLHLKYVIWAYPNAPGIRTQLWLRESEDAEWSGSLFQPDVVETLRLASEPESVNAFGYMQGIKADMEELILRQELISSPGAADWASGLVIEDNNAGIIVVKESHQHTRMEHGELVTGDFRLDGSVVKASGAGMRPSDLKSESYRFCWATWTVLYEGDSTSAQFALKEFDRFRFPVNERDISIIANTWGTEDRRHPCLYKARQENVLRELESVAEIGLDLLQIDDGWQHNRGRKGDQWHPTKGWYPTKERSGRFNLHTGEEFEGTYSVYPDGCFCRVRNRAEELGVQLGLWFAWRAPAEQIKANYNNGNFKAFKLDFANLEQKDDLDYLYGKGREIVKKSDYTAVVNWDVTETPPRMGYYFGRDVGNLYLANRKTHGTRLDVLYDPYKQLRDAWLLAKYMNLNQIQVTFQNKDLTPLEAPTDALKSTHKYNLAITLMATPIFFLETQYLDESARDQIKMLLEPYTDHRSKMYEGYVFSIGDMPDNASWSGFQNYHPETKSGYLTVFRELHNKQSRRSLSLHFYPAGTQLQLTDLLTGESRDVAVNDQNQVEFIIDEAPGFQFLKIEKQ